MKTKEDRNETIMTLYRSGRNMSSIARELGMTHQRVEQIISKNAKLFLGEQNFKERYIRHLIRELQQAERKIDSAKRLRDKIDEELIKLIQ